MVIAFVLCAECLDVEAKCPISFLKKAYSRDRDSPKRQVPEPKQIIYGFDVTKSC